MKLSAADLAVGRFFTLKDYGHDARAGAAKADGGDACG